MDSLAHEPGLAEQDKGPTVITTICIVSSISTLFVIARLYSRVAATSKLLPDDALIILSVVCGWLSVAFSVAAVKSGDGRHIQTLSQEQISGAVLWTMVGFLPGILSFCLPKLAVVYLLCRLLSPGRAHLIWLWFMVLFSLVMMMVCVFVLFAQCTPPRAQWDFSVKQEKCWSKWVLVDISRAACGVSASIDLYLAVYPGYTLYFLQINRQKKIALTAALGIGSISTPVTIYKSTLIEGLADPDFTYSTCELTICTIVEGSVIIIAACIPLLQPILERMRGMLTSYADTSLGSQDRRHSAGNTERHIYAPPIDVRTRTRAREARRKYEMDSVMFTEVREDVKAEGSQGQLLEVPESATHSSSRSAGDSIGVGEMKASPIANEIQSVRDYSRRPGWR